MNVPRFIRRLFRQPYDGFRHFAVVDEGRLYRCGQPRPDELETLIERHKLRTVISFRGSRDASDPDSWEAQEQAVCDRHGVLFAQIPCNHKQPPTEADAGRFLTLVTDPQRQPVLVHCRLGQQRTMLFVALYWVHVQGMDKADAEQEMDRLGFNIRHRRHQQLLSAFRKLADIPAEQLLKQQSTGSPS